MKPWCDSLVRRCRPALACSWLQTACLALRVRRAGPRIWVYPRVHSYLGPNAAVTGRGTLHIGRRWPGRGYAPTDFVVARNARLHVDGDFSIYTGCSIAVNDEAALLIGSGYINHHACIECFERIEIGRGAAIAKGATIRDSDAHDTDSGASSAAIVIGDHVWIGVNAIVLKGVSIGDGSIVAAGAVVTRDIPPHSLAAGVPARVVKTGVNWR